MAIQTLMGMLVTDEASYTRYRQGMMPILAEHGGGFRYDFEVRETLATSTDHDINRVFVIQFPGLEQREAFFANEAYRSVRDRFFAPAVQAYTEIATWVADPP